MEGVTVTKGLSDRMSQDINLHHEESVVMRSRRPLILTGAILLVGLAVLVSLIFRLRLHSTAYTAPLVISVQASYPGANAQTVADTVAAPIEEQVNGVESMLSMSSTSSNDGSYTLNVTFKDGTDLDMAKVLVENRVSFALPVIPVVVQMDGVAVRKRSPQPLLLVSVTSPDGRYDPIFLSHYATIFVKDELGRAPGVSDIVLFGQREQRMRLTLDADKLAEFQLSAMDVATAISQQDVQVPAGPIGQAPVTKNQQFQWALKTLGRRANSEEFRSITLKANPDGRIVRLKEVARVEPGDDGSRATLNGKPAVLLGIHPLPTAKPSDVSRAILDKLAELRARVPKGLSLEAAFDFAPNVEEPNNPATPEYLVIDVELPESASTERTARTLERAAELLRKTQGVRDVLALTEHPFSLVRSRPCLVVRLTPKDQRDLDRKQIAGAVRGALQKQILDALFRLSLPSAADGFPLYGFPIEFAIEDRGNQGYTILRQRSEALVEKMNENGKFSDAAVSPGLSRAPFLNLNIDRTKCLARSLEISDVLNTLQVYLGPPHVKNFTEVGGAWKVNVRADPRYRAQTSDLLQLLVRNKQNQLVRLGAVMEVRGASGPAVIERHNMYPIARITANLAEGVSLPEARSLCETLIEQEFDTKEFKISWRIR
jgi:multidrug efflux pump subunit AcrB